MSFDYYNFRHITLTDKINEEILFYEQSEYANVNLFKEYILYLRTRIGKDKIEPVPIYRYDKIGNKCEITKMNLDEHVKNMTDITYKRPWSKLKEFHKISKIKEFIDNLKFKANPNLIEKNKKYLLDQISNGLRTKKFVKNKSEVVYDPKQMKIINISCIVYNRKKGLYNIDWDA
jgi:hypothetical protein